MLINLRDWIWTTIVDWLNAIPKENQDMQMINDFSQLLREIKPADVVLFEGRSRVSEVIKIITLSPWTHAALYIGCLNDIQDPDTRTAINQHYSGDPDTPLVIESLLGYGTIASPLSDYFEDNLRICRPSGLRADDQIQVVEFATEHLGMNYDVRQLLDLARFMFPYGILPRRWRSSLFQHNAGKPTNIICSSMIARCFQNINYPITPIIKADNHERIKFHKRQFRLFVPSDFDYSPSFEILKFPTWSLNKKGEYRDLPWQEEAEETVTDNPIKQTKINISLINNKLTERFFKKHSG